MDEKVFKLFSEKVKFEPKVNNEIDEAGDILRVILYFLIINFLKVGNEVVELDNRFIEGGCRAKKVLQSGVAEQ